MTSDDDGVKPVHSDGEILERVYARGRQVRRRKRIARAATTVIAVSALFAMGAGVAATVHTTKRAPAAFNDEVSPSPSESAPDDTPTIGPQGPGPEPPTASPSPTDTIVCRNSTDPACGDFYWDPDPGPNAPLSITMRASSTSNSVQVGDKISVTVEATDLDAKIVCTQLVWGDEGTIIIDPIRIEPRYGPWTTPPKEQGSFSERYTHTYSKTGVFTVRFYANSGNCIDPKASPYASEASDSLAMHVMTPVDPTPSPTETPVPSPSDSVSPSPSTT